MRVAVPISSILPDHPPKQRRTTGDLPRPPGSRESVEVKNDGLDEVCRQMLERSAPRDGRRLGDELVC